MNSKEARESLRADRVVKLAVELEAMLEQRRILDGTIEAQRKQLYRDAFENRSVPQTIKFLHQMKQYVIVPIKKTSLADLHVTKLDTAETAIINQDCNTGE